jgi:hypothetical protein
VHGPAKRTAVENRDDVQFGSLTIARHGLRSPEYGTLQFMTPMAQSDCREPICYVKIAEWRSEVIYK